MNEYKIIHGDCVEIMAKMETGSVDAILTDAPYMLKFMGAKWDTAGKKNSGKAIQEWHLRWAKEAARVLKPGGFLVCFGATKTAHRLTCAIEDAGLEIEDLILWLYGTGWPKTKGKLKPAAEPAALARKPLQGRLQENIEKYGTGSLNTEACRVETNDNLNGGAYSKGGKGRHDGDERWRFKPGGAGEFKQPSGRWPANVVHDGSEDVLGLFPTTKSGTGAIKRASPKGWQGHALGKESREAGTPMIAYGDEGSAARYFYCAKASPTDREEGNKHPTVKPTELMRYLCRLVCPRPGMTILDPFMGSGSTGKAAMMEGFNFIGIEQDAEYVKIAEGRIAKAHKSTRSIGIPGST